MDIVYASDNNYFPYIYVSIKTLFESNKDNKPLFVHYIYDNVSQQNMAILTALAQKHGRKIDFIRFCLPPDMEKILPAYRNTSKTTYIKFWFASMFPNLDRVLYLDPDTLVLDDIRDMYALNFEGNLIAGVIECLPYYHRVWSRMPENASYINGGMVLCNLALWRREGFEQRAVERLADTTHNLNYDQGVLNEICGNRIKLLPPRYNALAEVFEFKNAEKIKQRYGFKYYYTQVEIDQAVQTPAIVHITGFLYGKPMNVQCDHPYAEYFRNQLKGSSIQFAYVDKPLNRKKRIRKFVLHHFPFPIYKWFESILDIRRRAIL